MSSSYVESSFVIENLTNDEVNWWKKEATRWTIDSHVEPEDLDPPYSTQWELDESRTDKVFVWFHEDQSFNPDTAASVVQRFLQAHRPDGAVWFAWAETCSRPRADQFGGGACFITAKETQWLSTWQWIQQQRDARKDGRPLMPDPTVVNEALKLLEEMYDFWTKIGLVNWKRTDADRVYAILCKLGKSS